MLFPVICPFSFVTGLIVTSRVTGINQENLTSYIVMEHVSEEDVDCSFTVTIFSGIAVHRHSADERLGLRAKSPYSEDD